jgi:hypothetical protein
MAASPSQQQINAALRRMQAKNPGVEFVVLRASNGEVAILPKGEDIYGNRLMNPQADPEAAV